ncbi:hypothetical protein HYH03_006497 [Edaphochlamys debaryana]|uniref:Uncharacterized protein n=1 Tax=Edaphochlamys debaryana TaxID=47281 RepID=A0A835Y5K1_9CHLO|nr:hypothetical protein HYH03_006497 [Edaphochlamys debaryana]|eukprot:KAG2495554.1 hypothetical protein HYH03_006497 [Edaphochlamys debaryana]
MKVLEHGFAVPELGPLFEPEAQMLFGNLSYVHQHAELPFDLSLHMILTTLNSFEPTRFTSLLTAYPVSRRAVLALLLERYLTTGGFTEPEAQLVLDISRRLFQLHKQAAVTKRIIEFFHVSKSGGTSFCQLGKVNGCKTEDFGTKGNCLIEYFRDHPRWTVPGALGNLSARHGDPWCARHGRQYSFKWHCKSRRALMTKMRFNFYSNELVMHDHNRSWVGVHPCREFLNVVIFREPTPRILSHMENILKEYAVHYARFNASAELWAAFDPASPQQWQRLAVPVFDNYVVRSLLGGQAYNFPPEAINATHLLAAKVVTLQFEVILSLTPATSELTRDIFALGLGWAFDLRHLHARPTVQRAVSDVAPAVLDLIRRARSLDQELYEFALVLQLLDAIAFGVAHDVAGFGVAGADGEGSKPQTSSGSGSGPVSGSRSGPGGTQGSSAGSGSGGGRALTWLGSWGKQAVSPASTSASTPSAASTTSPTDGPNGTTSGSSAMGLNAEAMALLETARASGKRIRRTCGYVGLKRKQGGRPPPPPPAPPSLMLTDGVGAGWPLLGLGVGEIMGGRWFNGVFYRNASEALEASVAATRAAAAEFEAAARLADEQAAVAKAQAAEQAALVAAGRTGGQGQGIAGGGAAAGAAG